MATIEVGQAAPSLDIALQDADGVAHTLGEALERGPLLLGIYKCSCQASKTMFPFLERLGRRYADNGLTVCGVSQDSENITRSFARRLDLSFPILIEPVGYPVSEAFGITATPTVFLIKPDGEVAFETMGFFQHPVNDLASAVATAVGRDPEPIVTAADEGVPMFVPG